MARRVATLLGGALLVIFLLPPPISATAVTPRTRALPVCRYADLPVIDPRMTAWAATLVDTIYRLPDTYTPPDLVSVEQAGIATIRRGMQLRALVIEDLRALDQAARAAGQRIVVRSAYRSAAYQRTLYRAAVAADGRRLARRFTARVGHSEHQLGTTVDLGSYGGPAPFTLADWGKSPTGAWVNANAYRFGFIRSYPAAGPGELINSHSCYASEPWHFRYVGRERAAAVHRSGRVLREWLWTHGAQ